MNAQKTFFGKSWAVFLVIILTALCAGGCASNSYKLKGYRESVLALKQNERLGKGVNLGNALEAPKEGEWGVTLEEQYFQLIKEADFDSVRIPVRWSAHASEKEPYTIDPLFFQRVDWSVKNALSQKLYVVLDMHHYAELMQNPTENKQRYLSLWEQISQHYKDYPNELLFEFLNEPCDNLKGEQWNELIKETLSMVRKSNPQRTVIVGPTNWNNLNSLDKLELPTEDSNIIVTCHYYEPFKFTHQGASWVGEKSDGWMGTTWTGTDEEKQAVIKDFDKILNWAQIHNRPIYIGEFGSYSKADMDSRILWTEFVARETEKRHFSWAYWEFCAGFGVYDRQKNSWNYELLNALIPSK